MVSCESNHRSSWFSLFEKVFVDNDPELVEILSQLSLEVSSYSNLDEKICVKAALAAANSDTRNGTVQAHVRICMGT